MPAPNRSPLDITVVCVAARWRVVVRGELDLSSGRDLVAVSTVLAEARAAAVELDLRDVRFIDTAGWKSVVAVRRTVELADGTCVLSAESPAVTRFRHLFADLVATPTGGGRQALATAG